MPKQPEVCANRRILVVDDNRAIHEDFKKVLADESSAASGLDELEAMLLGTSAPVAHAAHGFAIDSAYQGQEALEMVRASIQSGRPYAMAFVDMRMPPGWDGLETIGHLWAADPALQVVICSAYSDHSWSEISAALKAQDGLLILKKPFDNAEVLQISHAMTAKWNLHKEVERRMQSLEAMVSARTQQLESANLALTREMEERERVEVELRLSQKLESVGRLAAGIAHEINTPVQYVSDNVHFVRTSLSDLTELVGKLQISNRSVLDGAPDVQAAQNAERAEDEADLPYLVLNIPRALEQALTGLDRVASIVRSMKRFADEDAHEACWVDVNEAIATTLDIASHEYSHVADIVTDLVELPQVKCHAGELNQALLNLIVNAAHAIGDVVGESGTKGRIEICSRPEGGGVVVSIADTGGGIPESIRERIFDPFFTTKDVGRGSGQGLAIVRSVAERYGGDVTFATEIGRGSTFSFRLPLAS